VRREPKSLLLSEVELIAYRFHLRVVSSSLCKFFLLLFFLYSSPPPPLPKKQKNKIAKPYTMFFPQNNVVY